MDWHNKQPIYQQLKEKITTAILEGHLQAGESVPSIRQFSADHSVNPITVSKAYQLLVDEGIIEKRRGLGMFVKTEAKKQLLLMERAYFIQYELPRIKEKAKQLEIDLAELLK